MSSQHILVALMFLLVSASAAPASHTEQRYYAILVDGKEAGQAKLTITEQDDGVCYVAANASVKLSGLFSYSFQIDAQEWWKSGKLVGMKSLCNDNGRKCDLLASREGGDGVTLRLRVNGTDRAVSQEPWTTSFWKLPDAKYHNKQVPLLAADTGEDRVAQLQYVGSERLTVANLPTPCYRFRVTGSGNPIELWFDQHHRLVRQEFTESGHKTIIQLISRR